MWPSAEMPPEAKRWDPVSLSMCGARVVVLTWRRSRRPPCVAVGPAFYLLDLNDWYGIRTDAGTEPSRPPQFVKRSSTSFRETTTTPSSPGSRLGCDARPVVSTARTACRPNTAIVSALGWQWGWQGVGWRRAGSEGDMGWGAGMQ